MLGLGVTSRHSSWKSSRMWRNERGRDEGFMRITGWIDSPCSPPTSVSVDWFRERASEYMASSTPPSSRFELALSMAMSNDGGRASASAGVDCHEGKLDSVKVGVAGDILGDAEGVMTGKTVS